MGNHLLSLISLGVTQFLFRVLKAVRKSEMPGWHFFIGSVKNSDPQLSIFFLSEMSTIPSSESKMSHQWSRILSRAYLLIQLSLSPVKKSFIFMHPNPPLVLSLHRVSLSIQSGFFLISTSFGVFFSMIYKIVHLCLDY